MINSILLAAALAVPSPEAELEAKLPEVFARAAAHYKALDAAATPLMKDAKGKLRAPHGWKKWRTGQDELDMISIYGWTSGHYPGSLWYLYEATGDAFFKDRATAWTEILAPVAKMTTNHDVGFMMYCSYGNARRLLKTEKYDELLMETARSLSCRYNKDLGLIRSWGAITNRHDFLVIPDNLMNLELLEWAAGQKDGERFAKIAESHADVTMKHHFRPDGGCFHVLNYDQRPGFLGSVQEIRRGQGLGCESAWSRGESWAIYGYTMMYRTSGCVRYLDFAKKLADYAIGHPNMPEDGIPYWDYGAPGEERDSSAGAILASALVELSQYVGEEDRARYRAFAVKQLLALSSADYFSEGGEIGHFLLKHGVGHKPNNSEVDTPLDYGDYYYLEALLRFRRFKTREAAYAPVSALLPAQASLPDDEPSYRMNRFPWDYKSAKPEDFCALADKILKEPIPDTSDELYGEFWKTGNRSHYEKFYFKRRNNLDFLAAAEKAEGKGRYLPRIEAYLAAICGMKSWVLPAHDSTDGGRGTFCGTRITTDLVSTEMAAHLACVVRMIGDRLKPETVARVKAECERRVFAPVRREAPGLLYPETAVGGVRVSNIWWMRCLNNWNAVCWDNVVCAACGLLDDPLDRAFFVHSADLCADTYLENGFEADGYCSEGMGYWNYGYGHHLLMGRMLRSLTKGRFDLFRRPKQKLVAAYARAYTLREGISPAFADGNGAASPRYLDLVGMIWPDLPKDLPPCTEFPDGQVWLFRNPGGLSVAFKGGYNMEHHNHNDLGSYYLIDRERFAAGDPGGETYTARTFSSRRYESKVLNSYGHPVPVVGGRLQSYGREFRARVVSKDLSSPRATVVLDMTGAYEVKSLKTLTRTFVFDRLANVFSVTDRVEFSEPTSFESPYNTYLEADNGKVKIPIVWNVRPEVSVKGGDYELVEEGISNPERITPHRVAVRLKVPVKAAEVAFTYRTTK